ncbi:MAG: hypothetical protein DRP71_04705 [Verrucomicrobia bacterium]|nr:MAG: hypothetical protein DRP71_04705 [Verrucomicrobiota bacterium]
MNLRDPKSLRLNPKRRPLSLGRSTNLIWAILPSIAIVAALFVGFSYLSYFVREFMDQDKVSVRNIDGVVERPKPAVEQTPPPSPEEAMEAFRRMREAEQAEEGQPVPPPDPVYEEDAPATEIELAPVDVPPIEVPGLVEPRGS